MLLAWAFDARGAPFSSELVLGPPGPTQRAVHAMSSDAEFDGELYWVTYESGLELPVTGGALFALRVTEDGQVLDPNGLFVARYASGPYHTLSAAPWGALVTYFGSGDSLIAARLGRDGKSADASPRVLADGVEVYPYPATACLAGSCLVTFSTGDRIEAITLDGCGEPLPEVRLELPFGYWKPYPAGDGYVFVGSPESPSARIPCKRSA